MLRAIFRTSSSVLMVITISWMVFVCIFLITYNAMSAVRFATDKYVFDNGRLLAIVMGPIHTVYHEEGFSLFDLHRSLIQKHELVFDKISDTEQLQGNIVDKSKLVSMHVFVYDVGLDDELTEACMQLPHDVVLGISPYAPNLENLIKRAEDRGHLVFLGLPLLSDNGTSFPGPLVKYGVYEGVDFLLDKFGRSVHGVYTDPSETFSLDAEKLGVVMSYASRYNLWLMYQGRNSIAMQLGKMMGLRVFMPDFSVVEFMIPGDIYSRLSGPELLASLDKRTKGSAFWISILSSAGNLRGFKTWLRKESAKRFLLEHVRLRSD